MVQLKSPSKMMVELLRRLRLRRVTIIVFSIVIILSS